MEFVKLKDKVSAPSKALLKVRDYLAKNNLAEFENGQYNIEGDDFYVNIFGYTTTTEDKRIWEAHRDYIDVHIILSGKEIVRQADLPFCEIVTFHADRDYVEISQALPQVSCVLSEGYAVILYPEDGHQTGLMIDNQPETIRKAVFKVRV